MQHICSVKALMQMQPISMQLISETCERNLKACESYFFKDEKGQGGAPMPQKMPPDVPHSLVQLSCVSECQRGVC